jgi:chorismate-pyruvate lyase
MNSVSVPAFVPVSVSVAVPVEAFADRCTRMLLANNGSTTKLLEAALRTTISVSVHGQFPELAARLPDGVRLAMTLAGEHYVTIRDSTLSTRDGCPISRNYVVIAGDRDQVQTLATGQDKPLGLALIGASVEQHRTVLATGHHPWPYGTPGRSAASKTYTISTGGCPRLYLHEVFNPDLFPSDLFPSDLFRDVGGQPIGL